MWCDHCQREEVADTDLWCDHCQRGGPSQIQVIELPDDFVEQGYQSAFGTTREDAQAKGLCVQCKRPALPRCYSDAGRREYGISGMCEPCWDEMFAEPEGEGE